MAGITTPTGCLIIHQYISGVPWNAILHSVPSIHVTFESVINNIVRAALCVCVCVYDTVTHTQCRKHTSVVVMWWRGILQLHVLCVVYRCKSVLFLALTCTQRVLCLFPLSVLTLRGRVSCPLSRPVYIPLGLPPVWSQYSSAYVRDLRWHHSFSLKSCCLYNFTIFSLEDIYILFLILFWFVVQMKSAETVLRNDSCSVTMMIYLDLK